MNWIGMKISRKGDNTAMLVKWSRFDECFSASCYWIVQYLPRLNCGCSSSRSPFLPLFCTAGVLRPAEDPSDLNPGVFWSSEASPFCWYTEVLFFSIICHDVKLSICRFNAGNVILKHVQVGSIWYWISKNLQNLKNFKLGFWILVSFWAMWTLRNYLSEIPITIHLNQMRRSYQISLEVMKSETYREDRAGWQSRRGLFFLL